MSEYTQEQVNELLEQKKQEWKEKELKPLQDEKENLQAQVKELEQYKPKQKSQEEIDMEKKQAELFKKEKKLTLKEMGLEDFAELVQGENIDQIKEQAEKVNKILEQRKLNNNYIPSERKSTNEKYSKYEKEGNTEGMIGAKLSNLFKNA